jgi:hypothetical protein
MLNVECSGVQGWGEGLPGAGQTTGNCSLADSNLWLRPLTLIPSPLPKGRGRMLSTPQLHRSLKSSGAWPFIPLKTAKNPVWRVAAASATGRFLERFHGPRTAAICALEPERSAPVPGCCNMENTTALGIPTAHASPTQQRPGTGALRFMGREFRRTPS